MEDTMQRITDLVWAYGPRVLLALVILIVGMAIAKIIRGAVRKALVRSKVDETLAPFVATMIYYLCLIFVFLAVLSKFGFEITSIIAVLGGMALAVGLALQGTLSNFAAGVMLLIFRPFKAGDVIDAGGVTGKVIEIGVFSTTLHSPDNIRITAPNSAIYGQVIKNMSFNETRRNDMVMGIDYSDDIGKAIEVINSVLAADDRVLKDPEPTVAVAELADSSVNIVVRPWCNASDYWPLRFDLMRTLKEQLEANGCSIPFPQTDVHLHKVDVA